MGEKIYCWLAWRLPRGLAYWAAVRVGAYATGPNYPKTEVPKVRLMTCLRRWRKDNELDSEGEFDGNENLSAGSKDIWGNRFDVCIVDDVIIDENSETPGERHV